MFTITLRSKYCSILLYIVDMYNIRWFENWSRWKILVIHFLPQKGISIRSNLLQSSILDHSNPQGPQKMWKIVMRAKCGSDWNFVNARVFQWLTASHVFPQNKKILPGILNCIRECAVGILLRTPCRQSHCCIGLPDDYDSVCITNTLGEQTKIFQPLPPLSTVSVEIPTSIELPCGEMATH